MYPVIVYGNSKFALRCSAGLHKILVWGLFVFTTTSPKFTVCCSVLQRVTACVALCCTVLHCHCVWKFENLHCVAVQVCTKSWSGVFLFSPLTHQNLQCIAESCSVLQCVAMVGCGKIEVWGLCPLVFTTTTQNEPLHSKISSRIKIPFGARSGTTC